MSELTGRRIVVVGASSGLGRSIGLALSEAAARVAFLGRRRDRVTNAATEAGPHAISVVCDVRDESSILAAVGEVATSFGGIDALVYCAAVGPLLPLATAGADVWRNAFETNVVGASLVTSAVVPHLEQSGGTAMYLSSVSASVTPPWPGLGVYGVTKAALEKLVEAWNVEHPSVSFTNLVVGDCVGGPGDSATQFANEWDPDFAVEYVQRWSELGYLSGGLVDIADLVVATMAILTCGARIPSMIVSPRRPTQPHNSQAADLVPHQSDTNSVG